MNRFHPTGAAPSTPAFGTPAPSGAPESAASSAADARPSAAAAAHGSVFGATIPDSEEPGAGSSSAVSPSAPSAAFGAPVGQAPTSGTGSAGPIPADSAPHDFARPHTPVERQSVESRQSAFRPVSIQPVAAAQPPAPGAVPPAHAAPVEPFAPAPLASSRASATATGTPIDAGPSRAESAPSTQSGPIPTAANPLHLHSRAEAAQARVAAEAEASSPAWGEPARQAPSQAWGTPPPPPPAQRVPSDLWAQEHSSPQQAPAHANPAFGSAGPSDSYAPGEGDANSVLPRRRSAAEAPRVAFLVHAGSAPVELDRDVVIGRDPNTHVLTGRTQATPLRVPSPATEISRSHCAVISTGPSAWALMDLGSANGTLLRRGNGTMEDVIPMTTVPLSDGDLIDVGEGTTIEFRVR
ncbi:FHA domain-containing protein [Schaalia sp. 19OD2882]|nr:FHA domain-containing protein [Schaalia sp. 19OD2882]